MSYLDQLTQQTNKNSRTQNGALTNDSSLDPVLDFFSLAGAMRDRKEDAVRLFKKAYAQDELLAIRCLFYLRDVRGGQGERDLFRACVGTLPKEMQGKIAKYVPEYGRYDDWLFFNSPEVVSLIDKQLKKDVADMKEGKPISLLAKWLPSENASSKGTHEHAVKLMAALVMKPKAYRKTLSSLREHLRILERNMSAKEWGKIDYEKIPAQAHRKHIKAFHAHDEDRYTKYLESVKKGEKKINTSTLFTYEVFDLIAQDHFDEADAMWKNLPDYTRGENALVLADVSGSMSGRPMSISVSLALYFAERNKGTFKDCFMTFSEHPQVVRVLGKTLADKLANIEGRDWGMNTDIEAAFDSILRAAVADNTPKKEMPTTLYIISDMEFDECTEGDKTNFEHARDEFEKAGYELPTVVFWNVNSMQNQSPATKFDKNVTLISGSSQSTFRYAMEGKSPLESMNDILNSERYSQITI